MSSKPSWKKATNFAIHMGLLIATAPTLASNALDCVLEKGASVYDSSTSSKPLPQSLEENLQVTCLDKAENGRQKFSFENKTYFHITNAVAVRAFTILLIPKLAFDSETCLYVPRFNDM